ncbi:MAG: hypothetical protein QOF88_6304 [Mycobacterium sp.]|jgi:hypothetical protein|nr:hypothetical protein [Mycobacterium sp.]
MPGHVAPPKLLESGEIQSLLHGFGCLMVLGRGPARHPPKWDDGAWRSGAGNPFASKCQHPCRVLRRQA